MYPTFETPKVSGHEALQALLFTCYLIIGLHLYDSREFKCNIDPYADLLVHIVETKGICKNLFATVVCTKTMFLFQLTRETTTNKIFHILTVSVLSISRAVNDIINIIMALAGAGSFEIPVLCLLVHGEPKILKVKYLSLSFYATLQIHDHKESHLKARYLFCHRNMHNLTLNKLEN